MTQEGKRHQEPENHERWLVSYADMLTLLLAVFVVLYASRSKEGNGEPAEAEVRAALQETFGSPFEDIPADRLEFPTWMELGVHRHFSGDKVLPPVIKRHKSATVKRPPVMRRLVRQVERLDRLSGFSGAIRLTDEGDGLRVSLLARHFFESGSYFLKPASILHLSDILRVLKDFDRPVTVEGHADSQRMPGDSGLTNWELAALRATRVVRLMQDSHGFAPERLRAVSLGDSRPVASNSTVDGRALNRRIEIFVHLQDWR